MSNSLPDKASARGGASRSCAVACLALILVLAVAGGATAQTKSQVGRLCQQGYDLAYNLDYAEALSAFRQAIAERPDDPAAYRGIATITLLHILFERGVITVDDYLRIRTDAERVPVAESEESQFRTNLDKALSIAEDEVEKQPGSPAAHYDLGAAVGLTATYKATVEASVLGGLSAARRAFSEQEKVMELDSSRKDAGLIVGTYRYIVASLPFYIRFMAYVAGFGGGRERGIQLLEEAAAYPGDSQQDAKFALVLLYNREKRFDEALREIRELQERFPRNRLLWLEAGATALRAGRPGEAEHELSLGIGKLAGDRRSRSFGEESIFRYKRGAARVLLRNLAGAEDDLRVALEEKGREWVHARAHVELGKLADLRGNRLLAQSEYRQGARLCKNSDDKAGEDEAKTLLKKPYGRK
jgi:tetratricopeptide (TPR) repeat protein